jgi:hypothetical protein
MFSALLLGQLARCTFFPASSWQKLSSEEKEQITFSVKTATHFMNICMDLVNPRIMLVPIPDGGAHRLSSDELRKLKSRLNPKSPEKVLCGVCFMNVVDYGAAELADSFSLYIQDIFRIPATRKRGRKSSRDSLNRLMALRLRYTCSNFREARRKLDGLKDAYNGRDYKDLSAFNRACSGATEKFQEMFSLPRSDLPLHYLKGWGGRPDAAPHFNPFESREKESSAARVLEPAVVTKKGESQLPQIGEEASYAGLGGYAPMDEAALFQIVNMVGNDPSLVLRYYDQDVQFSHTKTQILDEYLARNLPQLMAEGRVTKLNPGVRIRIMGFYFIGRGVLRPCSQTERVANVLKLEILEGDAKNQTAFVSIESVKRL